MGRRLVVPLTALLLGLSLQPAHAGAVLSRFVADLRLEGNAPSGQIRVHLLSGGVFGAGGLAHGLFDPDTADNEPPGGAFWLVQSLGGNRPGEGERILTFAFDSAGRFMGIEPTPFYDPSVVAGTGRAALRIFLAEYPPDPVRPSLLGELDFRGVSGVTLGSLRGISGLQLVRRPASLPDLTFAPFSITQVPEPGTLLLLLGGGLAGARSSRCRCTRASRTL